MASALNLIKKIKLEPYRIRVDLYSKTTNEDYFYKSEPTLIFLMKQIKCLYTIYLSVFFSYTFSGKNYFMLQVLLLANAERIHIVFTVSSLQEIMNPF